MDIFLYLLLQLLNGDKWEPIFANSSKYKNWIAVLDLKTCYACRKMHGKIWLINEKPEIEPPVHPNCRCVIRVMKTVEAGTATINGENGRIWYEADINYKSGFRNSQRVIYSNDGLIFVTYDHYQTFFEIV